MLRTTRFPSRRPPWFVASVVTHAALLWAGLHFIPRRNAEVPPVMVVEIATAAAQPPPPPPPTAPEPPPPPKAPPPPKLIKAEAPPKQPELEPPPPPAAAQAAKTLTIDDKDAPPDADAMVQGEHDQYAGGVTASNGTSAKAVTDARAKGAGAPAPPKAADVDRSARASLFLTAWNCDHLFPKAAINAGVRHAAVHLIVRVGPDGRPLGVRNLDDPGHGFGEAARQCAFQQQYRAARNRAGQPIVGDTALFAVGFHSLGAARRARSARRRPALRGSAVGAALDAGAGGVDADLGRVEVDAAPRELSCRRKSAPSAETLAGGARSRTVRRRRGSPGPGEAAPGLARRPGRDVLGLRPSSG